MPQSGKGKIRFGCLIAIVGAASILAAGLFLLTWFGFGIFTEQVKVDLRDNPVIVEHIGNLEEIEVEFMASAAAPGEDDFVFHLRGSKGSGEVRATVITVDDDTEHVTAGSLRLPSGENYDLFPELGSSGDAPVGADR